MRVWWNMLGGLVLWAAHFFALYIIASIFPGGRVTWVMALAVTILILAIDLWRAARTLRVIGQASDALYRWLGSLSLLGYVLAAVAIIYQGLPAILQ